MDNPHAKQKLPLKFGTSGLRGLVEDMTDEECFVNTLGFLRYLLSAGQLKPGDTVYVGGDLRPSTPRIMQAVGQGILMAGCRLENVGMVPTPALVFFAWQRGCASIMVTGSHIPADRNGIKFATNRGEILKTDEVGILAAVAKVRSEQLNDWFDAAGMFRPGKTRALPAVFSQIKAEYLERYQAAFGGIGLQGRTIVVDQHSAVGRDWLVEALSNLGAAVIAVGRSDQFLPIDTENITPQNLQMFRELAQRHHPFAIVSTDGDSDRPFVVDAQGTFYRGDILGAMVACSIGARVAVVPISANDAVKHYLEQQGIECQQTKIGSPYVIAAMQAVVLAGKKNVVGWEVNGGFLLGSDIEFQGKVIKALPTRDAFFPIICVLTKAHQLGSLSGVFAPLPARFTQAGLLDQFSVYDSERIIRRLTQGLEQVERLEFINNEVVCHFFNAAKRKILINSTGAVNALKEFWTKNSKIEEVFEIKSALENNYMTKSRGFSTISEINLLDGLRICFENKDIIHIRPSGNAPQLRVYTNSTTQKQADFLLEQAIGPDGFIQKMRNDSL